MFSTFFSFELRSWLRAPLPWIFLFVFGLLTGLATASDNVQIGGSFGNVWKNAPFVAQNWYGVFSILSILLSVAFLNGAAVRDFENNTAQIVFSSPVSKAGYYFGHFGGALIASLIPFLGVSLGMWVVAGLNPIFEWLEPERLGPFEWQSHLHAYLMMMIPNLIFTGGVVYAVAAVTRSTTYAFISGSVLFMGYLIAGIFISDMDNQQLASLLDPFGSSAYDLSTKYWTVDEKNHNYLTLLHPAILINRLLWMSIGLAALVFGYMRFDFSERKSANKKGRATEEEGFGLAELGALPRVPPNSGFNTLMSQLWSQLRTEIKGVLKSIPFLILVFLGLLNLIVGFFFSTESYGTHNLPTTLTMVNTVRGNFYLFLIIILTYFSGALIWKERTAKVNEIFDALPTRNWTGYLAKFLTLVSIVFSLNAIGIVAGAITQKAMGYKQIELAVYAQELLGYDVLKMTFFVALFMFVHTLSPNMYLGFFLCIIAIAVNTFMWGPLDVSSNMLQFGSRPDYTYSDLYRYAPYSLGLGWFNFYWLLFCSLLAVAAFCLWPRGKESGWRKRLSLARQEWKNYRWAGIGLFLIWVLTAGFVFYNTKKLNTYIGRNESEKRQVRYEKDYKKYQDMAQPRIYKVDYDIALMPEKRSYTASGKMWVRNLETRAIDTLIVQIPQQGKFTFNNERLSLMLNDSALYMRFYKISPALAAGDSMLLTFKTVYEAKGFENELSNTSIMQNGTFFNNTDIAPAFGYQERGEMSDKNDRKKYGLPEKSRMPALDTANYKARRNQYLSNCSDWVMVETHISTAPDQIAIAPGSLVREWEEGGRRHFQYKLDHKAWDFYSFLSARYEVAREEKDGIKYEVYYHKDHAVNVPRMMKSMQKSIAYYTQNFGPYYHKQCRIIEFPRIASFAQAFPGTMPYSEDIGFIEDFKAEKDDIDMVFYVVAHEMGHQYWAHQECGAAMQGAEMTTETFAQYSALMIMEKEYGRDIMRKFLEYETDRYLRGRSRETQKEMPIGKCENQGYIHYQKGSAVMYYLKEMIGEAQVNAGLKAFLEKFRYKEAPYPTSMDAVNAFAAQTPDSLKYIIQDLFWDITLFENKTKEANVRELGDGKWEVTIKTESRKLKADELGKESEVPMNDWVDIGAFARPEGDKKYGKTLYRQRVKVNQKDNTYTFVVNEKPHKAGIDPFALLIDREPKDNSRELK